MQVARVSAFSYGIVYGSIKLKVLKVIDFSNSSLCVIVCAFGVLR